MFGHLELLRKKQRALIDNSPQQLAVACKNLGDCYHESQQYEKALECYTEEANAYELLGKRLEKSKAHRMIGEMYMLLENYDEALKHELIYLSMYSKFMYEKWHSIDLIWVYCYCCCRYCS